MFNYEKGPNEYRDEIIIPADKRDTAFNQTSQTRRNSLEK